VPENPKREGSPRLLTVPEIVEKHGISRQTIHAYRQRGVFPQPAPEQGGSTRLRFREDEVDAFVAANPKRPGGRPRTDPETPTEGESVSALDELTKHYGSQSEHWLDLIADLRAEVLAEAADAALAVPTPEDCSRYDSLNGAFEAGQWAAVEAVRALAATPPEEESST